MDLSSTSSTAAPKADTDSFDQLSPGVTVHCRDEQWLVTKVARTTDGYRVNVRGLSDYVRDATAVFYTALDDIKIFDPSEVTVVADESPRYRHTALWLESTLRQTPIPVGQQQVEVADKMLADPLDYQLAAVDKALDPQRLRTRILLADAVGLGKTLEIGMILAELIRRGRGERILVVTPKHVLEQFQQEMWTRFAIPLVRLDSLGIQQVRQKLPASKNPFTYFPRVIVSMDTLKSVKYRAQLEKVRWDTVVIDEIHNATNAGTQNNELARTLAPTTEALILASATPHNGDPDSFKELLRLLDPLAVLPDGTIDQDAAKDLIIRRHRNSPEVASVVGSKWAKRKDPLHVPVEPSPDEQAVARELHDTWLNSSVCKDRLFPWTLIKAFLSSPAALAETLNTRLRSLEGTDRTEEIKALERLQELNAKVTPENSAKFAELATYLTDIGVGKGKAKRAVVFSERVATLKWLQENLVKYLKLPAKSVAVMHGSLSDVEQMALIDEFKRENTPLRVLITGDVASEGVNLHSQCHDLVHYDIPWSLIRIQQRNGRIDRYGQEHEPQITTLLLDTGSSVGDLNVLTKLVDRETEAFKVLGDAASLMGSYNVRAEEDAIRTVLQGSQAFDAVVADPTDIARGAHAKPAPEKDTTAQDDITAQNRDIMELLANFDASDDADDDYDQPQSQHRVSLYPAEIDYLTDALNEAFHDVPQASPSAGGVDLEVFDNDIVEFTPPYDLQRRFEFLPQDYVDYRKVMERLVLATSTSRGNEQLQAAREGDSEKSWPVAHYLSPLHPVTSWAADRALAAMSQNEIPAFTGNVDKPTVFSMGTLTNARGQVVTRAFSLATEGPFGLDVPAGVQGAQVEMLKEPLTRLKELGLSSTSINVSTASVPDNLDKLVAAAVEASEDELSFVQDEVTKRLKEINYHWHERVNAWDKQGTPQQRARARKRSKALLEEEDNLLAAMQPERLLIRPLAVILPA